MRMIYTLITAAGFIFLLSFTTRPSAKNNRIVYSELASSVKTQIEQAGSISSCGDKITSAEVSANGDIQLRCSKNEQVILNVFQLNKTFSAVYGIEVINGNIIRFNFDGNRSASIRFNDAGTAKQVYESLIAMMIAGKDQYIPELPLDINETVDSINTMLARLSMYQPQVRVNITGTIIITNSNMQFFHFNVADLTSTITREGSFEVNGIELMPGNANTNDQINFNTENGKVAYLKFNAAGDDDLNKLQQLLIHLRASLLSIMNE